MGDSTTFLLLSERIKGLFPIESKGISTITVTDALQLAGLNPLINSIQLNWWNNGKRKAWSAQRFAPEINYSSTGSLLRLHAAGLGSFPHMPTSRGLQFSTPKSFDMLFMSLFLIALFPQVEESKNSFN